MFSPIKHNDKETDTMTSKIFRFCLAVFVGVLLLYLAVELLAQFWGWLVFIGAIIAAVWIGVAVWRRGRDGW